VRELAAMDPGTLQARLKEMGYTDGQISRARQRTGASDLTTLVNWLMGHPEEQDHACAGASSSGSGTRPVQIVVEDEECSMNGTFRGARQQDNADVVRREGQGRVFGNSEQLIVKLVNAVQNKEPKRRLVAICDEARERGFPDLINGLCRRDMPGGRTPLSYAVKMNLLHVAEDLIDLGANPNQLMMDDTTPVSALVLAATNDKWDGTEMLRLLLSKRADPSVLHRAGISIDSLNITMQYWLEICMNSSPISDDDIKHREKCAPMHKMHELK